MNNLSDSLSQVFALMIKKIITLGETNEAFVTYKRRRSKKTFLLRWIPTNIRTMLDMTFKY